MAHETNTPPEDDSRLQPMQDLDAGADDVLSEDSMPLADDVPDHSEDQLDSIEFKVDTAQRVKRLPRGPFAYTWNRFLQLSSQLFLKSTEGLFRRGTSRFEDTDR